MGTTTEIRLGEELARMYNAAPRGEVSTMVRLFGIRYAKEIKDSGSRVAEIIKYAKISENYTAEVNKAIKLAKYVIEK